MIGVRVPGRCSGTGNGCRHSLFNAILIANVGGCNLATKNRNSVVIEFRHNLDSLMKDRNLSLQDVATMAGVSKSVAHSWTTGAVPQNLPAVARLADELGMSFKVLLLGEQDNHIQGLMTENVFDMQNVFDGLCVLSIKKVRPRRHKT